MGRNMHSSNTPEYNRMRWQNMLGIFVAEYGQTKPPKDAIIRQNDEYDESKYRCNTTK